MKILTFTTLFPHNINPNFGIFIANRMKAVSQRGHEIKVVAPVPYFPKWSFLKIFSRWYSQSQILDKEERMGMEVLHPRYFIIPKIGMFFYGIWLFLSVLPCIYRLRKTFAFDVIDAHYVYPDGLAAILLGKIFRCPVVVSARGSDISEYSHLSSIKLWLRYILKSSHQVISVSSNLMETMLKLGANKDSSHIIHNGIDQNLFYFMEKKEARQKCHIPEDQKVILSVGGWIIRKNFSLLIEAMKFLNKGEHLYIIGKGPEKERLEKEIALYQIQDRVHLIPSTLNSELVFWYNSADIFCLPSLEEGSPNVVYESLACGCPVAGSNLAGIKKAIDHENKGIVVSTWEAKDFANALNFCLWEKKYDRLWISQEGQKRTWDTVAKEVEDVFQKALL